MAIREGLFAGAGYEVEVPEKNPGHTAPLGATVAEFEPQDERVHVRFDTRRSGRYDLVVGFDGFRSATRRLLFGHAYDPASSGYAAWRVITRLVGVRLTDRSTAQWP